MRDIVELALEDNSPLEPPMLGQILAWIHVAFKNSGGGGKRKFVQVWNVIPAVSASTPDIQLLSSTNINWDQFEFWDCSADFAMEFIVFPGTGGESTLCPDKTYTPRTLSW